MNLTKTFVSATVGITLATMAWAAPTDHPFGTDIFHFKEQTALADQGVEPGATGNVSGMHDQQGQADIQKIDIVVKNLTPGTPYEVDALIDGGGDFVPVDAFVTDAAGSAALHYQKIVNSHGNAQANGRGKRALPTQMNPVNMVIGVAIVDTNAQPVLAADLLAPDHMQILIKRDISSAQVPALMILQANDVRSTVKINAFGLAPNGTYSLALNNQVVATGTAAGNGRLSIGTTLTNATDVLHLFSVSLLDGNNSMVVGTPLP